MAHVVVLGAGLGGTIMAYELRDAPGAGQRVSVVNKGTRFWRGWTCLLPRQSAFCLGIIT